MAQDFSLVVFRVGSTVHAMWAVSYDVLTAARALELGGGITVLRIMVPGDSPGGAFTWVYPEA